MTIIPLDRLDLQIDKLDPTPAYLQMRRQIASAIHSGRLVPGHALPSERDLAAQLHLSRMTVRRAVEALVEDRLVERRQGSGTYVRSRPLEQTVDRVLGFTDEARSLGFQPGTRLLEVREELAGDDERTALGLPAGVKVLSVTRLRTADGAPLAIQRATLAPAYAGLSLDLLRSRESLYETLRAQFGVVPHHARQTVTARLPDERERRWLEVGPHQPVLALERISRSEDGEVFEYVRSAYRGDLYRMALDLAPPDGGGPSDMSSTPDDAGGAP